MLSCMGSLRHCSKKSHATCNMQKAHTSCRPANTSFQAIRAALAESRLLSHNGAHHRSRRRSRRHRPQLVCFRCLLAWICCFRCLLAWLCCFRCLLAWLCCCRGCCCCCCPPSPSVEVPVTRRPCPESPPLEMPTTSRLHKRSSGATDNWFMKEGLSQCRQKAYGCASVQGEASIDAARSTEGRGGQHN